MIASNAPPEPVGLSTLRMGKPFSLKCWSLIESSDGSFLNEGAKMATE